MSASVMLLRLKNKSENVLENFELLSKEKYWKSGDLAPEYGNSMSCGMALGNLGHSDQSDFINKIVLFISKDLKNFIG